MSEPPSPSDSVPPAEIQRRLAAAEALLACYRQAIGHDLPNHLVALHGLVHLLDLEQGDRLTEEGRDYVGRLKGAVQRCNATVQLLGDIGRVGREPPGGPPADLALVARQAAREVEQLFPGRAIQYDGLPQGPANVPVAPPLLRKLLVQLLRNAVQAVPADRPARVRVEAHPGPDGVRLEVGDNGRGLSEERLQQLREFFAGGRSLSGGLGLFLVRRIVQHWGGHVEVQATPGAGSVFTVHLPTG